MDAVADFWESGSCGEVYAVDGYDEHARLRYELEPHIPGFARFADGAGKDVLEIGVGMGADHAGWAREEPARLVGVDLTQRALEHTARRMETLGLESSLYRASALELPFESDTFDIVYSYGVLHHTPDPPRAISEVHRVLRPGGIARIMLYHSRSLIGTMLWLRYGVGRKSLEQVFSDHLESPGTRAYTVAQAEGLFGAFTAVDIDVELSFADLLEGEVGQRHRGAVLAAAKALWPRALLRRYARGLGFFLLIEARK